MGTFENRRLLVAGGGALFLSAGLVAACAATKSNQLDSGDDESPIPVGVGVGNSSGGSGAGSGDGGSFNPTGGGDGGAGGIFMNPCGTECGDTEICTEDGGIATDENCDGQVDEGCMCDTGTQSCFKGDASFLGEEGCYPGTQTCTELGVWGPCDGGVHATDMCYEGAGLGCHPIQTPQFVPVDLMTGTGNASAGATTNEFAVQCPVGISPCPTPTGTMYTPLQSGEYTVTYTKDGTEECTFPLFVGAPGLRLELAWDWDEALGDSTVDLDLHLHKPNNTEPWGGKFGNDVDCAWDNCTADDYTFFGGVEWWVGTAAPSPPPPVPVAWTFDQVVQENNTCYYAPKGNGQDWQDIGQGCHNPRLDIDNITCDPTVTDVNSGQFCNPENTNVDVPPFQEWFRIGVHYYSAKLQTYDVHPSVKIFCNGALAAELGTLGYNDVVTFPATDGDTRYWLVADVAFLPGDECEPSSCVVEPLYLDAAAKTPYFTTADEVSTTFTPPYPPIPMP